MSETPAPKVVWAAAARAQLRAIDREPALQILYCLTRYVQNRSGDVKKLHPPFFGFRLHLRRISSPFRLHRR